MIGSFKRMKGHMAGHVDDNKVLMFSAACDQVRTSLTRLCEDVRKQMLDRSDGVYVSMHRDYMSIIGGVSVGQVSMPREERAVRRQLDEAITAMDESFQKVIDSDLDDLKDHDVPSTAGVEADENVDGTDEIEMESNQGSGSEDEDPQEDREEEQGEGEESMEDGDYAEAADDVASEADEEL